MLWNFLESGVPNLSMPTVSVKTQTTFQQITLIKIQNYTYCLDKWCHGFNITSDFVFDTEVEISQVSTHCINNSLMQHSIWPKLSTVSTDLLISALLVLFNVAWTVVVSLSVYLHVKNNLRAEMCLECQEST